MAVAKHTLTHMVSVRSPFDWTIQINGAEPLLSAFQQRIFPDQSVHHDFPNPATPR